MAFDRGGVAAQRLGQNRNGAQLREFVKPAEPRGACAEATRTNTAGNSPHVPGALTSDAALRCTTSIHVRRRVSRLSHHVD